MLTSLKGESWWYWCLILFEIYLWTLVNKKNFPISSNSLIFFQCKIFLCESFCFFLKLLSLSFDPYLFQLQCSTSNPYYFITPVTHSHSSITPLCCQCNHLQGFEEDLLRLVTWVKHKSFTFTHLQSYFSAISTPDPDDHMSTVLR